MESICSMQLLRHVMIPYRTDQVSERHRVAAKMDAAWSRASGSVRPEMSAHLQRIQLLALEGDWSEVNDLAIRGMNWHANLARRLELMAALGPVARNQGNVDLAWDQVNAALPGGPATEPGSTIFPQTLDLIELAVHLCLDTGDLDDARAWLETHDRWVEWSGGTSGQAIGTLLWARYHLVAGDLVAARTCAEESLELASDPRQPLVLIAALRFLGELDTKQRDDATAEHRLQQSIKLAEACAAPFKVALSKLALAELRDVSGKIADATALLDEVVAICEPLGARPTLERASALSASRARHRAPPTLGLTRREMDVLRLLVAGMSDREIAEELFISHHTVMRHVSNILGKLNVDSRTAAAITAVRHGIA
jgi:ATP/maltotriose-dependent transcriptional regulator MalT